MELLLTPGPVMIPKEVMTAIANSNVHHRTPEFESLFGETLDLYQQLINCECRPVVLAATGTGAMEASLRSVCTQNDKVIVLQAGKFAQRWTEIARVLGLNAVELKKDWGQTFSNAEVETFLKLHSDATAVCCQYCETSTTALHNVPELAKIIKTVLPQALFLVDGITAVGALKIDQTQLAVDILIAGSQKALMLPPGMALVSMSKLALARIESTPKTSLYFDLAKEYKNHLANTTAFTAPISLVFALNAALKLINKEGADEVYARHAHVAEFLRQELTRLDFKLLADTCPAPSVTGAWPPSRHSADDLRQKLLKHASIRIAGGQDQFKGKVIRIGHMGSINIEHARTFINALSSIA